MSWPSREDDLKPNRANDYITYLLDVFLTVRISGESLDSDSSSTEKIDKAEYEYSSGQCAMFITIKSILLNITYLLG